jgi:hypothetical protein
VNVEAHPLVLAARHELEALGQLDTQAGVVVISLAKAMVDPTVSGSALVATSRELSRVMATITGRKPVVARPPDELTARRTQRVKSGYGVAFGNGAVNPW